ncbi:MAG: hypothetical protein EOR16_16010 [Mesorhizobium sp.]|uniref:hypothetical protein n=1 Tax=Mesorhizobium sp. TaxID=1871066 RepID=UPI000FE6A0EF|nr:hypothetical protein [Mesorhizobium sp.]RWI57089.1 MAG: hypothetical protein EOR16_16010 [Mesorhizobium sp.]
MHIKKIHSVQTITLVARELGEDDDWLAGIAAEMEPVDGLIWAYSVVHEDGVMALTEFGVESLRNLIAIYRDEIKLPPPLSTPNGYA